MNDNNYSELVREMQKQTSLLQRANRISAIASIILGALVILAIVVYPISRQHKTSGKILKHEDSWQNARDLIDNTTTLSEGIEMTNRLINNNPEFYYGYALLGSAYHEQGDMNKAEQYYSKASDLFPTEDNKKTLKAIRQAKENQEKGKAGKAHQHTN